MVILESDLELAFPFRSEGFFELEFDGLPRFLAAVGLPCNSAALELNLGGLPRRLAGSGAELALGGLLRLAFFEGEVALFAGAFRLPEVAGT
jgi:hypothetical protein